MRCRNHRRAELHYSQLDELDDHLSKANTAQSLATAIIKGDHRLVPEPKLPNSYTQVQLYQSEYSTPQGTHRSNAIGWGRMYSGQIS